MDWWRITYGKSSLTVTNFNNTTVTNSNLNWWWLTVSDKSAAVIGTISYIQGVPKNVYTLQIIVNQVLFV